MRSDVRSSVVTLLSLAILTACSGGGGGGGDSSSPQGPIVTLKGSAVKGTVAGGQVSIFALDQNGARLGGPLASTTTAADGSYSVAVSIPGTNSVVAVLTGGVYVDENTGKEVTLQPGEFLEAYAYLPNGNDKTIHITPLTSIAAAKTRQLMRIRGDALSQAIAAGNINVSNAFRIGNALERAVPKLDALSTQDQEGANYALLLGALTILDEEDVDHSALGVVDGMVADWDEDGVPGNRVGVPSVDDWLRAVQELRARLGLTVNISADIAMNFNTAPNAKEDDVFVDEDTVVEINVLANDSDPNGDAIFFVSADATSAKGVSLVSLGEGRIQYTPPKNFTGVDTFKYKVRDSEAHTATGLVKINIKSVNDAPVTTNDNVESFQGIEISGVLKATDIDNAELTYSQVTGPTKGTLIINATTGVYNYRSNADAQGLDAFTFKASDGLAESNVSTVNVTIQPRPQVPGMPIALTAAYSINEDQPLVETLRALDSDNNVTSFTIVSQPTNGTLVLNNPLTGAFTYSPSAGFHGSDTFEFRATDAAGNVSNVARISIAIQLVNDRPVVENSRIVVSQDDTVQSRFVASDPDGDALVYEIATNPTRGVARIIDVQNGTFTYTPNASITGRDSLTFRVTDTFGASTTGTLEIVIRSSVQPIMIIAAHPDDVVRMASGVLARTRSFAQPQPVKIVVLTNGDAESKRIGYKRQAEMITAAAIANISPDDVIFLGYPDDVGAGLFRLYNQFVTPTSKLRVDWNQIDETYGKEGLGRQDFHSYLTGTPAIYNKPNLVADLQTIVERYKPTQIYTHSFADDHPDNRITYLVALEATANVMKETAGYRPDILTSIVHSPSRYPYADKYPSNITRTPLTRDFSEDFVWPLPAHVNPSDPNEARYETAVVRFTPDVAITEPPSLVKTTIAWDDRLILPVPADMQVALQDPTFVGRASNTNPKFQMLLAYQSTWLNSKEADRGHLFASGKSDEVFFELPWSSNVAAIADISATSQNTGTMQIAANVVDGIIDGTRDGAPSEIPTEWAATTPNSELTLTWPRPVVVDTIRLYDRPQTSQNITSGVLRFSDGPNVIVGALPADGSSPHIITLNPARSITSMTFEITSAVGNAPGLAEVEVFAEAEVIANRAPYFVTGPLASNNNYWVGPGEAIELFALGRDDDADGITYTWSATSGQITGNGPTVQYRAPNTVGVIDIVTVQITDGVNAPISAQFAISVPANVARVAAVWGSSQSFTPGDRDQSAENVVDGDISGETAPNEDRSAEWRSDNEKAGAFIELTWTKPVTIDRIRLYDRPNPLDQVIAGIITFSDGTSINVGQLPNDMTMSELQFPAKTITSLRFTVTEVSGSTGNIGLAEIEALRPEAP